MNTIQTLLITDFTSDILKGYLNNAKSGFKLKVEKSVKVGRFPWGVVISP